MHPWHLSLQVDLLGQLSILVSLCLSLLPLLLSLVLVENVSLGLHLVVELLHEAQFLHELLLFLQVPLVLKIGGLGVFKVVTLAVTFFHRRNYPLQVQLLLVHFFLEAVAIDAVVFFVLAEG